MNDRSSLLIARNVSKRFYATQALDRVSFDLAPGEVHTLVGENGAGKSTLIKVIGGIYQRDEGEIIIDGVERRFRDPREAQEAGVVVIPQEMQLVAAATVAENVTLGDWPSKRQFGFLPAIDRGRMRGRADEALRRLKFSGDLDSRVDQLPFAERQLVAIAKALCRKAEVLILDEPTASLEQREAERLFDVMAALKAEGVGIIFVSHRLDEVVRLSDRCTVLRDGRVVDVSAKGNIAEERLIRLMTGRDLEELHRPHRLEFGETLLQYNGGERDLPRPSVPEGRGAPPGVDRRLDLRQGAIVGLAGLLGSGTTAYLRKLFGAGGDPETVKVRGDKKTVGKPSSAIRSGVGMVPGDRADALVMGLSVRDNIVLPHLHTLTKRWRMDLNAMNRLVDDLMEALDIRPRDPGQPVRFLSGGNQQKAIFARWLAGNIDVLLLDEPTHGIDVGAKARIHRLMRDFVEQGGGILFTSSEIVEVVSMSDSVLAMRHGDIVARISREGGEYSEGFLRSVLGG
ncbi:MAG: sugar ABC transporter ATP-binding protein [Nitrospinota bacterium]